MNPGDIDRRPNRGMPNMVNPQAAPTRTVSASSGGTVSSSGSLERKQRAYQYIREFIMRGINQVKEELLPLLFYQFYKIAYDTEKTLRDKWIANYRGDFIHPSFQKDILYLENVESAEKEVKQILSSYKTILVTQFTYEAFISYIKNNNLTDVYEDINREIKLTIKKSSETETDSIKMATGIVSDVPFEDIKRTNEIKVKFAPLKDDALFMSKLESFYVAKRKNEIKLDNKKMKDKLASDVEISENTYLEKSEIPLPEHKFKYKVEFAKAYLDRAFLDENAEPNILNVSVKDPFEQVTCMEIEKNGNLMIYGFLDGKILLVVLNSAFEDINSLEKKKKQAYDEVGKKISAIEEETQSEGKGKDKQSKEDDDKYEVIEFRGHEEAITSLSLNYDELYALSSSVDATIRLWCFRQRTCIGLFKGHINTVWKTKFCSRGFYFASGSSDTTARIWSTDKSYPLRVLLGHKSDVNIIEFFENCNYLATASLDKSIRVWEVSSGKCVRYFFNNNEVISTLAISYYGHYLATGSEDGQIVFWDLEKLSKPNVVYMDRGKRVNGLSFSIDETYMVASSKKRINYYNIERLKNEQKDIFTGVLKQDLKLESSNPEILASNSIHTIEIPEYDFMGVKFSIGNFIYALSRSHN